MPKNLPDIIYDKSNVTPFVDSHSAYYKIQYYKDTDYFSNIDSYTNFVKGVERLVRTNDRYSKYINYLKKEVRLDHCQILKDISDEDFGKENGIEMHHGPIFTLYDYCCIMVEYFLLKKWKISTARIADQILTEHQLNRIQVVMVTTSMHELIHSRSLFINYRQAFGDLAGFLNKYGCALSDDLIEKLDRYIDRSLLEDSTDFGILKLNESLYKH